MSVQPAGMSGNAMINGVLTYGPMVLGSVGGAWLGGAPILSQRGAMIIVPASVGAYFVNSMASPGLTKSVMQSTQSFVAVYVAGFGLPMVAGLALGFGLTKVL